MRTSMTTSIAGALALALFSAIPAAAEVGKKISVATWEISATLPAYPAFTTPASVATPTTYKSKTNYLKVTVAYQYYCGGGDNSAVAVRVDGQQLVTVSSPFDSDTDGFGTTSRTLYLVPESAGGPAITPGSMVTIEASSFAGTGCTLWTGTLVVEAVK